METTEHQPQTPTLIQQAATVALVDLKALLTRLDALTRALATPNADRLIEALAAYEASGITTAPALSSAASSVLLHATSRLGAYPLPMPLAALAVRAVDIAADHSRYGEGVRGEEWAATIQRISSMTRPSLSGDWADAVQRTPLEAQRAEPSVSGWSRQNPTVLSAVAALSRAQGHYKAACGSIRALEVSETLDAPRICTAFHFMISGDRAMGRGFAAIAAYISSPDWQPLTVIPRRDEDEPKPAAWLGAAWRTSLGLRLPANIAATIAYRGAGLQPPEWATDLAAARHVVIDLDYSAAFVKATSNQLLKTVIPKARQAVQPAPKQEPAASPAAAAADTPRPMTAGKPARQEPPERPRMRPPIQHPPLPGAALDTAMTMERVARNPFLVKVSTDA